MARRRHEISIPVPMSVERLKQGRRAAALAAAERSVVEAAEAWHLLLKYEPAGPKDAHYHVERIARAIDNLDKAVDALRRLRAQEQAQPAGAPAESEKQP